MVKLHTKSCLFLLVYLGKLTLQDVNIKSMQHHLAVAARTKLQDVRIPAIINAKNLPQASNLKRTINSFCSTFPVFMAGQISCRKRLWVCVPFLLPLLCTNLWISPCFPSLQFDPGAENHRQCIVRGKGEFQTVRLRTVTLGKLAKAAIFTAV